MKDYYELRTIRDLSDFVNECIAFADSGRYKRSQVAGWIVGLLKLDFWDAWYEDCPDFAMLYELAVSAEIDEDNANDYWPQLLDAAKRLETVAEQSS